MSTQWVIQIKSFRVEWMTAVQSMKDFWSILPPIQDLFHLSKRSFTVFGKKNWFQLVSAYLYLSLQLNLKAPHWIISMIASISRQSRWLFSYYWWKCYCSQCCIENTTQINSNSHNKSNDVLFDEQRSKHVYNIFDIKINFVTEEIYAYSIHIYIYTIHITR